MAEPLTAEQRSLRARLAAHALHARRDPREATSTARAALWQRYLDEVDPAHLLPDEERARRAAHARQRDMLRLALASSRARTRRDGGGS